MQFASEYDTGRNVFTAQRAAPTVIGTVAEKTAEDLLLSCLTEEQRNMYFRENKIQIVSNKGNIFTIGKSKLHNLIRMDMQGNAVERWCVTALGQVPICDSMLAQKLWLETDEDALAALANITLCSTGQLIRTAPQQHQFSWERDRLSALN